MRILHLSTSDSTGGAARAAYRLHSGLKRLGHQSTMLVLRRGSKDPDVAQFKIPNDLGSRVRGRLRARRIRKDFEKYAATRPAGYEQFSDDRTPFAGAIVPQLLPCDVINLHWVAQYLDHEHFFTNVPKHIPIVWRLADMAPLTCGCHYDHGCGRFAAQCGACPQLGSTDPNDLSHQIWQRKSRSLAQLAPGQLHLVGTSTWIASESRRSSLLKPFPITVIPNGLDVNDFAPRDKGFARDLFDVPRDAKVILFASESLETKRKGFSYVVDALSGLSGVGKPFLVSVGALKSPLNLPIPHLNLGKINNDRLLSVAYSLADVFVIASLQESFGQTVTESLACGTPVVAFDGGGPSDMVRPGVTGWLAPVGDVAGLRHAITKALADDAARATMAANCRRIAVAEYSLEAQASAYARLYERLLAVAGRPADKSVAPAALATDPMR
ncbi:MAG: glycosyltransferase family 4 protein [Tepidisphaeraceae bacterium]